MLVQKDNFHISFRPIFGYNKPFNAIISPREAGKSTELVDCLWNAFKKGKTSLLIRRQVVDITDAYITSINEIINKFYDEKVVITYKKGALKDGIVYLYINEKLFACLVALSVSIARIKSMVLRNVRYFFFDEFIVNPSFGEKYLKNEADKFKEVYNTFYREADEEIKCFFLGNPYSHYNPYFSWWGVDTQGIKVGSIQQGSNWCVWCYELKQELRDWILARNPLYQFDDSYKKYGFEGRAICDSNIRVLDTAPKDYTLRFIFRIEGKNIGVYQNKYINDGEDRYWCGFHQSIGSERIAYCFDFQDMIDRCALVSSSDKSRFNRFKIAMRNRAVTFSTIEVYYLMEEVFNLL